jgi:serine/threonine-protein kinase HipA
LSPAYDFNPTPTDVKARILTTNIDLDEGTCSIALFGKCRGVLRFVAETGPGDDSGGGRRDPDMAVGCAEIGCKRAEITRMASTFEHDDLGDALRL